MPLVKGLFAPIDVLAEQAADPPVINPFEIINLFFSPKASHFGGTSSETTKDVNARPPTR